MVDPLLAGTATRAAAGLAVPVVKGAARKLAQPKKLRRAVQEAALARHLHVDEEALKQALKSSEVSYALRSQTPDAKVEALEVLARVPIRSMRGSSAHKPAVEDLWDLVNGAYRRTGTVEDAVAALSEQVRDGSRDEDAILFDTNLDRLSKPHKAAATDLARTHPLVAHRIVGEWVRATDHKSLMQAWFRRTPNWLSPSAATYAWLMELSLTLSLRVEADGWGDRALGAGTEDDEYINVRLAVSRHHDDDEAVPPTLQPYTERPLTQSVLGGSTPERRIELLSAWSPRTPNQAAFRDLIMAQFLRDAGRHEDAIMLGREAWDTSEHYGAAVMAAECMLRAQLEGDAQTSLRALAEARDFALALRDRRRVLRLPGAQAIEIAMNAIGLLGSAEDALHLALVPPEGVATIQEAAEALVFNGATVLLAELGQLARAQERLSDTTPAAVRHQVAALAAAEAQDDEAAAREWHRAIEVEPDLNQKVMLTFRAASSGHLDDFLTTIEALAPERARDVRLIAALNREDPEAIASATSDFERSRMVGHTLISTMARREEWARVATLAERAAELWGAPDDLVKAAKARYKLNDPAYAYDLLVRAILRATDQWAGRARALSMCIELASARNDWSAALDHARSLVELEPAERAAQWGLVKIEFLSGDQGQAFITWSSKFERPSPTDSLEAAIWMQFRQDHGDAAGPLTQLVELNAQFADDQQVRLHAVTAVLMGPHSEDSPAELEGIIGKFLADFPEQTALVPVQVDETEKLLDHPLFVGIAERWKALQELEPQVTAGNLPTGLAAALRNVPVATYLVRRLHPIRRLTRAESLSTEQEPVKEVVVDVTALFTLATLEPDSAVILTSRLDLQSTQAQLADLNAAREELRRDMAVATRGGGDTNQSGNLRLELHHARYSRMHRAFNLTTKDSSQHPRPMELIDVAELDDISDVWLSSLQLAAAKGLPLWCDDAGLASVAAIAGVATVSTFDLIEAEAAAGRITVDRRDALVAQILHGYGMGFPYEQAVYDLAIALDGNLPGGGNHALRWAPGVVVGKQLDHFTTRLLKSLPDGHDTFEWAALLGQVIPSTGLGSAELYTHVYAFLLTRPGLGASELYKIHTGLASVTGTTALDALKSAVATLLKAAEPDLKNTARAGLVQRIIGLPDADRLAVLELLLAPA